jgi:hypothetical protein
MEHHVIMEKLCSCAKKEGIPQIETFEEKSAALDAAQAQLAFMQSSFCGKHNFDLTEVNDHYVIGMTGCGCGSHDKH